MELIEGLMPHSRVLDLGASAGSFAANRNDLTVVRLDLEKPHAMAAGWYVWGDAARMPFATDAFDLICSNPSLEHFRELEAAGRGGVAAGAGALRAPVICCSTIAPHVRRRPGGRGGRGGGGGGGGGGGAG